jgi:hypothetical protein
MLTFYEEVENSYFHCGELLSTQKLIRYLAYLVTKKPCTGILRGLRLIRLHEKDNVVKITNGQVYLQGIVLSQDEDIELEFPKDKGDLVFTAYYKYEAPFPKPYELRVYKLSEFTPDTNHCILGFYVEETDEIRYNYKNLLRQEFIRDCYDINNPVAISWVYTKTGQTTYRIPKPSVLGKDGTEVFLNGLKLREKLDFEFSPDAKEVTLKKAVTNNEILSFVTYFPER